MKTLILISIMFLPAFITSQDRNMPCSLPETTIEKGSTDPWTLVGNTNVILYFFSDTSPDVIENLEMIQELAESREYSNMIKIIPVFNPENSSEGSMWAALNGSNITLEPYIDANGELQRSLGLPMISSVLVTYLDQESREIFSGSQSCTFELASMEAKVSAGGFDGFAGMEELARNTYPNK